METMVITTENDLKKIVKAAISELDQERRKTLEGQRTYTINTASKRLKLAHNTLKKYVLAGVIKSTASGRISEQAINDYLAGK